MQQTPQIKYCKSEAVKELERLSFEYLKDKFPSFPYPPKQNFNDRTCLGLAKCVQEFLKIKGYPSECRVLPRVGRLVTVKLQGKPVIYEIKSYSNTYPRTYLQRKHRRDVERSGGEFVTIRSFEQFYKGFNANPI